MSLSPTYCTVPQLSWHFQYEYTPLLTEVLTYSPNPGQGSWWSKQGWRNRGKDEELPRQAQSSSPVLGRPGVKGHTFRNQALADVGDCHVWQVKANLEKDKNTCGKCNCQKEEKYFFKTTFPPGDQNRKWTNFEKRGQDEHRKERGCNANLSQERDLLQLFFLLGEQVSNPHSANDEKWSDSRTNALCGPSARRKKERWQ